MSDDLLVKHNGVIASLISIAVLVAVVGFICSRAFFFCLTAAPILLCFSVFHIASHSCVNYLRNGLQRYLGLASNLLLVLGSIGWYIYLDKQLYLILFLGVCCIDAVLVYGGKYVK